MRKRFTLFLLIRNLLVFVTASIFLRKGPTSSLTLVLTSMTEASFVGSAPLASAPFSANPSPWLVLPGWCAAGASSAFVSCSCPSLANPSSSLSLTGWGPSSLTTENHRGAFDREFKLRVIKGFTKTEKTFLGLQVNLQLIVNKCVCGFRKRKK